MKAPINEETKAAFMAQYWKQNVVRFKNSTELYQLNCGTFGKGEVELRDISSLTDEEKIILAKIVGYSLSVIGNAELISLGGDFIYTIISNERQLGNRYSDLIRVEYISGIDYLRSIGILLSFRGIPCEEILQAGWATIRKEGE